MKKLRGLLPVILLVLLLAACNRPQSFPTPTSMPDEVLQTVVAATLTSASPASPTPPVVQTTATVTRAAPSSTPLPSPTAVPPSKTPPPTPTEPPANIYGQICYPDGPIPAMTVYFENLESQQTQAITIKENQESYSTNLGPGTYRVYAWLNDFSRGGLYSQAVICGMHSNCDDHTPVEFKLPENSTVEGVDVCDWYAYQVPYPSNVDPKQRSGALTGRLNAPREAGSGLRVVVYNTKTNNWYYVEVTPGRTAYFIDNLPPGPYHVVAYGDGRSAGGHAGAGHMLVEVIVKAGETATADINDWGGNFSPDPTR